MRTMTINAGRATRLDPSRTVTLRRQWQTDLSVRFDRLRREVTRLIVEEDALGLRRTLVFHADEPGRWITVKGNHIFIPEGKDADDPIITHAATANTRWKFHSTDQKVVAFLSWLKRKIVEHLVGEHLDENAWWGRYIVEGWRKGAGRAFDDTRPQVREWQQTPEAQQRLAFYTGTREEFLRSSFNWPVSREKVRLLASRTFTDLKGVTDGMAARIAHSIVDGLTRGENPRVIGRDLARQVDVGKVRAQTIARTEIIRTHAEGQLDAFERLGVAEVGVMAEWATAGDARVCPKCKAINGVVLKVDEARGLLPRHPNCRCAWLPANIGFSEDKSKQKRTRSAIERAIDASYAAGMPQGRTLEQQWRIDPWGGADKTIAKARPKSVLNADVLNKRWSFFADCERDEEGHCLPEGQGGAATATRTKGKRPKLTGEQRTALLIKVQKMARAKAKAAPEPTDGEVARANERIDAMGADRYESQIRGNVYDRKRSRLNLLSEFGDGHHCHCVYCGLTLDESTVTRDKIKTAREGGRYKQSNLVPACLACNQSRGDTPWEKVKWAKK